MKSAAMFVFLYQVSVIYSKYCSTLFIINAVLIGAILLHSDFLVHSD